MQQILMLNDVVYHSLTYDIVQSRTQGFEA